MNHKPWCATNIQCAVYHNNGICPDKKPCSCNGYEALTPPQEKEIHQCCRECLGRENMHADCPCHLHEKEIDKEEVIAEPLHISAEALFKCLERTKDLLAADRAALKEKVEGMYMYMAVFPGSPYTLQWREAYNKALQEVVKLLHSPEKN